MIFGIVWLSFSARVPPDRPVPAPSPSPAGTLNQTLSVPSPSPSSERQILDIDPEKLVAFFDRYNNAQAEDLTKPYLGKWMEISGRVWEVSNELLPPRSDIQGIRYGIKVSIYKPRQGKKRILARLMFEDAKWIERTRVLKPNAEDIKAFCQLKTVFEFGFILERCELIE